MTYWWVNQNQTSKHEISGGYLWSPKRRRDKGFNRFYENMRDVQVGDVIFSFFQARIQYLGIATHTATSGPKPEEFGATGQYWNDEGWMVPVSWYPVPTPFRPKDIIAELRPYLPRKYSPLQDNGDGLQGVYLAALPDEMAEVLLRPISSFGQRIMRLAAGQVEDDGVVEKLEEEIVQSIRNNTKISTTEQQALIKARRGQGQFRQNLETIEVGCRLTGVRDRRFLRASHIKPWRACENNHERLDGHNGLLLTPTFDLLFDKGFITFEANGRVLVSPRIPEDQLLRLGIDSTVSLNVGCFSDEQAAYLKYHRENIYR